MKCWVIRNKQHLDIPSGAAAAAEAATEWSYAYTHKIYTAREWACMEMFWCFLQYIFTSYNNIQIHYVMMFWHFEPYEISACLSLYGSKRSVLFIFSCIWFYVFVPKSHISVYFDVEYLLSSVHVDKGNDFVICVVSDLSIWSQSMLYVLAICIDCLDRYLHHDAYAACKFMYSFYIPHLNVNWYQSWPIKASRTVERGEKWGNDIRI